MTTAQPQHVHHPHHRPHLSPDRKLLTIFHIVILLVMAIFCLSYGHNLYVFATQEVKFLRHTEALTPALKLGESFACSPLPAYFWCGSEHYLMWGILISVEIVTVIFILKYLKKRTFFQHLKFVLRMQLSIILALSLILIVPMVMLAQLSNQAQKDIAAAQKTLGDPQQLRDKNILTDATAIASEVASMPVDNFVIVERDANFEALYQLLGISRSEQMSFYSGIVVPHEITTSVHEGLHISTLLFPSHLLIVHAANKATIETLTPTIATKLVSEEFKKYITPKEAQILFLGRDQYVEEQKKEEEKMKKRFEDYIADMNAYIGRLENNKALSQKFIDSFPSIKDQYQKDIDNYRSEWGNWYNDCKNSGAPESQCEAGRQKIEANLQVLQTDVNSLDADLDIAKRNITNNEVYKKEARQQLALVQTNYQEFLKNPVTAELQGGVFDPPERILIRYYDDERYSFASYMETVLHEYVHFYAYGLGRENLDAFLNEGITDFLALGISHKYMPAELVNPGYPAEVTIINKITQKIPTDKLVPVFFNQGSTTFKSLFTQSFPNIEYDAFIEAGKNLFYISPNDRQAKSTSLRQIESLFDAQN